MDLNEIFQRLVDGTGGCLVVVGLVVVGLGGLGVLLAALL